MGDYYDLNTCGRNGGVTWVCFFSRREREGAGVLSTRGKDGKREYRAKGGGLETKQNEITTIGPKTGEAFVKWTRLPYDKVGETKSSGEGSSNPPLHVSQLSGPGIDQAR